MNKYSELINKQQNELDNFPIHFAFDEKQLNEGLKELGLNENETDKIIGIGAGGFIRKSDLETFTEMMQRHRKEFQNEIENDTTGENFIKDMFLYELANHEFCITYELDDTLDAVGLTIEDINNSKTLKHGLEIAKTEYLNKHCQEDEEEI